MFAHQLPEANVALRELVDQIEDDKTADPKLRDEARETLANAQYYMTWLMRLEGLGSDEWEPEIESARQTYRLLAEQAEARGRSGIRAKASRGPGERHPARAHGARRAARTRYPQAVLELQERPVQEAGQEAVEWQEARAEEPEKKDARKAGAGPPPDNSGDREVGDALSPLPGIGTGSRSSHRLRSHRHAISAGSVLAPRAATIVFAGRRGQARRSPALLCARPARRQVVSAQPRRRFRDLPGTGLRRRTRRGQPGGQPTRRGRRSRSNSRRSAS